jgi:hypothetical protein
MIDPALMESSSNADDASDDDDSVCRDETPIISSSISKTIKASVMLIHQSDSSPHMQVHLYGQYGYSLLEMAGVWRTLDFAISLPGFENVSHVKVCVHASPREGAMLPGGVLDGMPDEDEEGSEEEREELEGRSAEDLVTLPTPPVDGWLKGITLHIDKSVKFEINDFIVLSTSVFIMLRPYAITRMRKDDGTMECPTLDMTTARLDILLGMTAAVSSSVPRLDGHPDSLTSLVYPSLRGRSPLCHLRTCLSTRIRRTDRLRRTRTRRHLWTHHRARVHQTQLQPGVAQDTRQDARELPCMAGDAVAFLVWIRDADSGCRQVGGCDDCGFRRRGGVRVECSLDVRYRLDEGSQLGFVSSRIFCAGTTQHRFRQRLQTCSCINCRLARQITSCPVHSSNHRIKLRFLDLASAPT